MRFLLPLSTRRELHTGPGREGTSHPSIAEAAWRLAATRWGWWIHLCRKKLKSWNAAGLSHELGDVTNDWMPWFMGPAVRLGERTISSHLIWFNCKGPSETRHTRPEKYVEKLLSIQTTCQELEQLSNTVLLSQSKISTIPIIYNYISHSTSTDWPNTVFRIIEMRNGLEPNSITYSNPQTNKSNIAQGQNAFHVTGSKTKEQAIKKISHFSQHTVFLSYFL